MALVILDLGYFKAQWGGTLKSESKNLGLEILDLGFFKTQWGGTLRLETKPV